MSPTIKKICDLNILTLSEYAFSKSEVFFIFCRKIEVLLQAMLKPLLFITGLVMG